MKIAVVLGYWLNNDGTPAMELRKRIDLAYEMINEMHPDLVILSGGVANKRAKRSEASVMFDLLREKGVDEALLKLEDESKTTLENAINSSKIMEGLDIEELIIVSSLSHFTDQPYNPIKYFYKYLPNKNAKIIIYTKSII